MREPNDDLSRFIHDDVKDLSDELRKIGILLEKL